MKKISNAFYSFSGFILYCYSKDNKFHKLIWLLTVLVVLAIGGCLMINHSNENKIQEYKSSKTFKDNKSTWNKSLNSAKEASSENSKMNKKYAGSSSVPDSVKSKIASNDFDVAKTRAAANPDMTVKKPDSYSMDVLNKLSDTEENSDDSRNISNNVFLTGGQTQWVYENFLAKSFNMTDSKDTIGFDPYKGVLYVGFQIDDSKIKSAFEKRANDLYAQSELSSRVSTLTIKYLNDSNTFN